MTDTIHKLADAFSRFPGIGKRQATRFVYHLLRQNKGTTESLARLIENLHKEVVACSDCGRYFMGAETESERCATCLDNTRDATLLMIVEKDSDYEAVETSRVYTGRYFILGGTVPYLEKSSKDTIHTSALTKLVSSQKPKEVILALSATPEGEHTAILVREALAPLQKQYGFTISTLGRGLSTGTELEYSDTSTLKSALDNRK